MGSRSTWTFAAKLLTGSAIFLMIAVGLCAAGGGFDTHVSQLQVWMSYAGAVFALVALTVFVKACAELGRRRRL